MTFGNIKSTIESNLIDSYKNPRDFKKTLREFKENVLNNKSISKVYSVYEQLSKPQGLSESDANVFLNEGLNVINKILPSIKLPYSKKDNLVNNYSDIDNLVYTNKINLKERVESRKRIIENLMSKPNQIKESVKIPISSMVKIANQTLESYVDSMDENSKKIFIDVIKTDKNQLEEKFNFLKENTISKLNTILSKEPEEDVKQKIVETIEKLQKEDCSQINLVKLISLESSL